VDQYLYKLVKIISGSYKDYCGKVVEKNNKHYVIYIDWRGENFYFLVKIERMNIVVEIITPTV
jgi:hypothetical protein